MISSKRLFQTMVLAAGICLPSFSSKADLWVTGYYPAYASGAMPISEIDFTVITHVVHFSLFPNGDGSLNTSINGINNTQTTNIITRAHNAGRKALICIGGAGSYFPNAASTANVTNFVNNLASFMGTNGYDGIDLDWEPLNVGDEGLFTNLVVKLRAAIDTYGPNKLLTVALPPEADVNYVEKVKNKFDQINIMTYDLSGPYDGWVTWFNAAIYDGGYTFPSNPARHVPSIEGYVQHFTDNDFATNKLGIGLAFYGYVWYGGVSTNSGGVVQPRQGWTTPPAITNFYQRTYNQLISSNFSPASFHYDEVAQAAWIGTNGAGTNDMFISYDDERTIESKISYARNRGLGGVIIWELSQDHVLGNTGPLMKAAKRSLRSPGNVTITTNFNQAYINFYAAPLGSYRLEWTTNFTNWTPLSSMQNFGTGAVSYISDSLIAPQRFYRVATPK